MLVVAGTTYQRSDGFTYVLDADVSEPTGPFPITKQGNITASNFGSESNLIVNDVVTLQSPIAGVDSDANVSAVLKEGEDEEGDESYQQRIVDRIQERWQRFKRL